MAHWLEIWCLISFICGGTLVGDMVSHWFDTVCGGSLVGDMVAMW